MLLQDEIRTMNKEQCDKDPGWHRPFTEIGIKNVCSHCPDKDKCEKAFKKVWKKNGT